MTRIIKRRFSPATVSGAGATSDGRSFDTEVQRTVINTVLIVGAALIVSKLVGFNY